VAFPISIRFVLHVMFGSTMNVTVHDTVVESASMLVVEMA
jgi:hypothetical protein